MIHLRDGSEVEDVRLDRLVDFDESSRMYGAVSESADLVPAHYGCDEVLDQGAEGACVGFSLVHHLLAAPNRWTPSRPLPRPAQLLYYAAQRRDQWPGGAYPGASPRYEGTAVLAGCKVLRAARLIRRFEWAFGVDDVLQVLARRGPVVLGIPWYASMYEAPGGVVSVSGKVVGGHAILCNGIDIELETVTLHNSWGPDWGVNGEAHLSWNSLDRLLSEDGEAVLLI